MAHQGATLVGATLVAFLVPLLALLTLYHWLLPLLFKMDVETFLPVTDFPQSRFSMVIILVPALLCLFFLRLLFLYLRWRLNQANAHYKNFSFNVLFGVGAFAGAHLLLLERTFKVQLLGTYLLVTSFRLFYQSLLVAAVHVYRNFFNSENRNGNRKLRFGFVYQWNEPFTLPLVLLLWFLMIFVLPVLEFFSLFTSSPPPEVTAPKPISAYFHLTLLANLVLVVLYGVALPLVKLNRWWTLVVKAALEYLMLLVAQLILLNSISLLVTILVWPLWKICISAYPCCGMRLVVHRRCRHGNGQFLNNRRRLENRGNRDDFEATGTAATVIFTTAPESGVQFKKEEKEEMQLVEMGTVSSSSASCRPFPEAQVNIENFVVPAAAAAAAAEKASETSETSETSKLSDNEMETPKEPELEQRTGLITKEEVGGAEGKQGEVDYLRLLSAKVAQVQRLVQDFIALWEWKLSGNEDEEEFQRPTAV